MDLSVYENIILEGIFVQKVYGRNWGPGGGGGGGIPMVFRSILLTEVRRKKMV